MPIRVISGSARGRKLKLVPGDHTRPVMDRVKESLFNIIGQGVRDSRWLDLFAGTGSVGIEALSRGASYCLFLDISRDAVRTIYDNLRLTKLDERAEVRRADAFAVLSAPRGVEPFDIIYIAPPQYREIWKQALLRIDQQPGWLNPDGIAVAQIDPKEYQEITLNHLRLNDQRRYGNTLLCFYKRPGE